MCITGPGRKEKGTEEILETVMTDSFPKEHQTPSPRPSSGRARYNVSTPYLVVFLHNGNKRLQIKQIVSIYGPDLSKLFKTDYSYSCKLLHNVKITERYPQLTYYDKAIKTGHAKERKKL